MYVIIVGAGKVGLNLARELLDKGHEVTLLESDRRRYRVVEAELGHVVQYGDATELWVLERAGVQRTDLVIAVTGDDEDNMLVCQVAKEKYGCERVIAHVNNPRSRAFQASGDPAGRLCDRSDPAPDRARGARLRSRAAARARGGAAGDHRARSRGRAPSAGRQPSPMSRCRMGPDHLGAASRAGFVPNAETVVQAGDQVLLMLDPGLEGRSRRASRTPAIDTSASGRNLVRMRIHSLLATAAVLGAIATAPVSALADSTGTVPGLRAQVTRLLTAELQNDDATVCAIVGTPMNGTLHGRTCVERWHASITRFLAKPGAKRELRGDIDGGGDRRGHAQRHVRLDRAPAPAAAGPVELQLVRQLLDARGLVTHRRAAHAARRGLCFPS